MIIDFTFDALHRAHRPRASGCRRTRSASWRRRPTSCRSACWPTRCGAGCTARATTFLRVAECAFDALVRRRRRRQAREIRITGAPAHARGRAARGRGAQGRRAIARWRRSRGATSSAWRRGDSVSGGARSSCASAGLDALPELPLDGQADPAPVVEQLAAAGFTELRLTVDKARRGRARRVCCCGPRELQDEFGCIQAINPLPMTLTRSGRPPATTT